MRTEKSNIVVEGLYRHIYYAFTTLARLMQYKSITYKCSMITTKIAVLLTMLEVLKK
jgi:hypothetical protein